ncbi:helix-turn-helix domain-containing protein [Salinispora vitiensis]|uniref:helix-turn-helix domain-containing protein n=1 Tax=Salinispora vitiensis TaxID=999544 RepID=UPI00036855E3|nr:helix-turn-helix transcriptional regulator [Salinispora vitiensis]
MALRQLRLAAGRSLEDIRDEMDWSLSKVRRIESGVVSVSVNDLRALLAYYGVADPAQVDRLVDMARSARRRHWAGQDRAYLSTSYAEVLGVEDDASRISQYHPFLIPGLLRTQDYARLVATASPHTRDSQAVEAWVRLCMARQDRAFSNDRHHSVRFVLDERALKAVREPDVMRHQIGKILGLLPRLNLVILQWDSAAEPGFVGPFSCHEFCSDLDPDVVCLENQPNDVTLIEHPDTVARYKAAFRELFDQAVPGAGDPGREILNRHGGHC